MKNWVEEKNVFAVELESGKVVKIDSRWVYNTCDTLELDITEALEMWLEDNGYLENEEQEQLDQQAKGQVKVLAKEKTERKKTTRERKPNPDKEFLISEIAQFLGQNSEITNILVENVSKIITFCYKNANYKLDLVQKRPPKGEK